MKIPFSFALFSALIFSTQNCSEHSGKTAESLTPDSILAPVSLPEGFNEYWFAGKAELCSYDVTQARYGEIRQAEQVNVFVMEDFSRAKHVKLDDPAAAADRVPVLKLNSIRRFHTGIYDYSIMQSVFTPLSGLPTLKTTTSVQDWCGQVFMQNNLEKGGYRLRGFSYFEGEGDQDLLLPLVLLEDEIWTRIRLNPSTLPTGKVKIIPSSIYIRLQHKPAGAQNAEIQLEKGEFESLLKIVYTDIPRSLRIRFATAFPCKILAWEETQDGKIASKGVLKSTTRSAYWEQHDNIYAPLRDSLRLRF